MRWSFVLVIVAACGGDVSTATTSGSTSATESGASTGAACPTEAQCREGSVGQCGASVEPICGAESWSCPDGSIEASACEGPLPCDDRPPGCWIEDSSNCDDADMRAAICLDDGMWQCPPGTQEGCTFGRDHCGSRNIICVESEPDGCSDITVPPECDGFDWYCPVGSTPIDRCRDTTSGSSSSDGSSSSSSDTGSSSTT